MPSSGSIALLALTLAAVRFQLGFLLSVVTQSQFHVLNEGDRVSLECSFRADHYSLFDYPVIWRKQQLNEETQINVMGSLNEPYVTSNRFEVTLTALAPVYLVELSILDVLREDSGNYTCEVRGPQSLVLGKVVHHLFVRASVDRMAIVNDDSSSSTSSSDLDHSIFSASTLSAIHVVENHPCRIRCVSFGGYPPPSLDVYIGRSDVTSDFVFQHGASLSGLKGLRVMTFRTERSTTNYLPKAEDDDSLLKCIASVPGLKPVVELVRLDVDFSPKISCASRDAHNGQRDVDLVCEVIAKPPLSAIFWIINANGTTLTEGEVIDDYWSLNKERVDGSIVSHLYISRVRPEHFRPYTIVAENNVAIAARDVDLFLKAKSAAAARPLSVPVNSHVMRNTPNDLRSHGYVVIQRSVARRLQPENSLRECFTVVAVVITAYLLTPASRVTSV